jgi:predicted alpha/beta superfamily hydrolase
MKNIVALALLAVSALISRPGDAAVDALGPLAIADRYEISSPALGETREFYLSLPESYSSGRHDYPVWYVLDADQNMQQAVASARLLAKWRGIPEMIIVGIPATNRIRDFTPSENAGYSAQSGGGENFMKFLTRELIPYIDASYRTHPFRLLSGHSLSGLLAANELVEGSDEFNAFIITAPALWWNDFEILMNAGDRLAAIDPGPRAVYFGIGELDGYGMKQELQRLVQAIRESDSPDLRFDHKEYAAEGHMSAPMPVTYDGLLFVFADIAYGRDNWDSFDGTAFTAREAALRARYGSTAMQTAETYSSLGDYLLQQGKYPGAISVFAANAEAYPGYAPNHEWLANAYVLDGDLSNAKAQYQKAYELAAASVTGEGNADQYLEQLALLETPGTLSDQDMGALAGCYASGNMQVYIYTENGRLFGRREGSHDFELFADSNGQFFMRVPPGLNFAFGEDDSGKALTLGSSGRQMRLPFDPKACTSPRPEPDPVTN